MTHHPEELARRRRAGQPLTDPAERTAKPTAATSTELAAARAELEASRLAARERRCFRDSSW